MLDSIKAALSPARVVPFLIVVSYTAAGVVAAWLAENFPEVHLSQGEIAAVILGLIGGGIAHALGWRHGWEKYEERVSNYAASHGVNPDAALSAPGDVHPDDFAPDEPALDDLDGEKAKETERKRTTRARKR